jgi:hypothetical protein
MPAKTNEITPRKYAVLPILGLKYFTSAITPKRNVVRAAAKTTGRKIAVAP